MHPWTLCSLKEWIGLALSLHEGAATLKRGSLPCIATGRLNTNGIFCS